MTAGGPRLEKGCQKGSPEAPTGGQLLPTGPTPHGARLLLPLWPPLWVQWHLYASYRWARARPRPGILSFIIHPSLLSVGLGPARAQVFYLSSYTHHSYQRARARPGPGISFLITTYPSLLSADIHSIMMVAGCQPAYPGQLSLFWISKR